MKDSDPAYDKTKNFYDTTVAVDLPYANGTPGAGTLLEDITSGTVTITKNGTAYNIVYTMDYGGQTVTGKYVGVVPNLQD